MTRNKQIELILRGSEVWNAGKPDVVNLHNAKLCGTNLVGTILHDTILNGVKLTSASLLGAAPTSVLLANWGSVSAELCRDLMRYNAANHPDGPKAFTVWATDGPCPYKDRIWSRAANFTEQKELWKSGEAQNALKLVVRLLEEKCYIEGDKAAVLAYVEQVYELDVQLVAAAGNLATVKALKLQRDSLAAKIRMEIVKMPKEAIPEGALPYA